MTIEQDELARLQLTLMDHEQVIEQYSDLLCNQQSQIDELRKQIDLLQKKLSKYDEIAEPLPSSERPPHY